MKYLKKYIPFLEASNDGHKYGVVMIEVPVNNWSEITSWIDPEDIFTEKGIQDNPHLTLLYGLHKGVTAKMVKRIFKTFDGTIDININGIGVFENPQFDVVKFNVDPEGSLQYLFDRLSELPNSNEFPDYVPHITIAYVKKGTGRKYVDRDYKKVIKNATEITYSMVNGKKSYFDIGKKEFNESIVKAKDLERVPIEGETWNLISKYLKKYNLDHKQEFKKKCEQGLQDVMDIWNEIPYELPKIKIDFSKFLYEYKKQNNSRSYYSFFKGYNSTSMSPNGRWTDIDVNEPKKSMTVLIGNRSPFREKQNKELSLMILESLDRCEKMGVKLAANVDVRHDSVYPLNLPYEYKFYSTWFDSKNKPEDKGKPSTISIELFNTNDYDLEKLYKEIYFDINNTLRKELREIGYGLISAYFGGSGDNTSIPISLFKLKPKINESLTLTPSSHFDIYEWFEELKSLQWNQKINESELKSHSDHFIGQGWYDKIKEHVDKIFNALEKVDAQTIHERMYDVYDQIPFGKQKYTMCCVIYGDYDKINESNRRKFSGLISIPNPKDKLRKIDIIIHILKSIVHPTLSIGWPDMEIRTTEEERLVTNKRYQCQNFNINDYEIFKNCHTTFINKIKTYNVNSFLKLYAPAIVIEISNEPYMSGKMNLRKLEADIDEVLPSILPELDYEEVLFDSSRFDRLFDDDRDIYEYTLKILLKV